jgi:hypothetical protein
MSAKIEHNNILNIPLSFIGLPPFFISFWASKRSNDQQAIEVSIINIFILLKKKGN